MAPLLVPANVVASGLLSRMDGVGDRAIPLEIALPIRDAIAAGEIRYCWITGQPIGLDQLTFDHVIPFSYGGATNNANLLPALRAANCGRGNSLDLLYEQRIGWRWDLDHHGRPVRVPDHSQRLVRVVTDDGIAYWSVPKLNFGELAMGAVSSAALALALEGATQWRAGDFQPGDLAEEAAKAAASYAARYSAKVAVKSLAPKAAAFAGAGSVEFFSAFAGPVGFVAAIYGAEAVEQGIALARRRVRPAEAAKAFALAPIGAVKDTAQLLVHGYKLASPKHRTIRRNRARWQTVNFIPDLNRADPREVLGPQPVHLLGPDDRLLVA